MADPNEATLQQIERERAAMFRPDWIRALVSGSLPLGETFWGGFLGMQLVLMPLWLVLVAFIPAFAPGLGWWTTLIFFVLQAVWTASVTQAVIRVAPGARQAGAWRWVAILVAVITLAQMLVLFWMWGSGRL